MFFHVSIDSWILTQQSKLFLAFRREGKDDRAFQARQWKVKHKLFGRMQCTESAKPHPLKKCDFSTGANLSFNADSLWTIINAWPLDELCFFCAVLPLSSPASSLFVCFFSLSAFVFSHCNSPSLHSDISASAWKCMRCQGRPCRFRVDWVHQHSRAIKVIISILWPHLCWKIGLHSLFCLNKTVLLERGSGENLPFIFVLK